MNLQSAAHPEDTLILGIGNRLCGDDGAGPRVIDLLAAQDLPPGVLAQDAGLPGWGLPNWLEGWSTVLLVDAVEMGAAPGCWRRFRPEEVKLWLQEETHSLHEPGLANGLALAQALDLLPERLEIYGIQPEDTTPGATLSPAVSACLPHLMEQILIDSGKG